MKRQRGRGRNKPSGQQHHNHNHHRNFESNGPDIKIRGSASNVYEKYQQLARDASSAGDRIMAESYLQHAEHYFRLMRMQQQHQQQHQQHQQRDRVDGVQGGQGDFAPNGYAGQGRDEFDDAPSGSDGSQATTVQHMQPAPERQVQQHQPQPPVSSPLDVVDPEAVGTEAQAEEGARDEMRSRRPRRRRRYEGAGPQGSDAGAEAGDPGSAAFDRASNS